jgi:hypothetical protein
MWGGGVGGRGSPITEKERFASDLKFMSSYNDYYVGGTPKRGGYEGIASNVIIMKAKLEVVDY